MGRSTEFTYDFSPSPTAGDSAAERTASSHALAAAAQRERGAFMSWDGIATFYRDYQASPNDLRRRVPNKKNELMKWNIAAAERDAHLLIEPERRFRLRVGRNALGSSLINYVDGPTESEERLRQRLLKYVASNGRSGLPRRHGRRKRSGGYQRDVALRLKVEAAAMARVERWYLDRGWTIERVHLDYVGWDLEAQLDDRRLRLEVKGCSANEPFCELTPNEYSQLNEYRQTYRVCIVTDALRKKAKLWQFRFVPEKGDWRDDDNNTLALTQRVAASGKVHRSRS